MVEISLEEELLPASGQVRLLQESFLLQLIREDWPGTDHVRTRLRQLKLAPLAAEGLRLRFAAAELKLPAEGVSPAVRRRQLAAGTWFQLVCREAAAGWKHIYPFVNEANPLQVFFVIPLKEGSGHADRTGRFLTELEQKLNAAVEQDCTVAVAAGLEIKGLKRLRNAFASCLCNLDLNGRPGMGPGEADAAMPVMTWLSPEEERRLLQIIETADTFAFEQELTALFGAEKHSAGLSAAQLYQAVRLQLLLTVAAGKFAFRGTALCKYLWNSHAMLAACTSPAQLTEQLSALGLLVMDEVKLARQSPERGLAEAVRKYIERNYGWELQPAAAAQLFGVEEGSLTRQFKQHVGIPFADYTVKIRMGRAEQLLPDEKLKLTDLAPLVGYASLSHFVSAFKKYSGKSPKEFRERLQKSH
ncbi:AraC family transcriptional regulator [Paenibacillus sp. FSL R7-0345]|uniref:helix-turn-helix domain-containing protein n=1 Tax=Paenibacillus sp. FSL R7-0345 TaxID=2954535 RepID=UPI00315A01D3